MANTPSRYHVSYCLPFTLEKSEQSSCFWVNKNPIWQHQASHSFKIANKQTHFNGYVVAHSKCLDGKHCLEAIKGSSLPVHHTANVPIKNLMHRTRIVIIKMIHLFTSYMEMQGRNLENIFYS